MTPEINGKTPPQPSLRPTNFSTLAVAALAAAAVAWLAISRFYDQFPTPLPWLPPLILSGLAVVEAVLAPNTKARIDRKEGTTPVNPLVVVRYVVLAKASSLTGALFAGFYTGVALWLISEWGRLSAASLDLPQAVLGVAGSLGLVGAGLWLERSCRVPPSPPEQGSATDDDSTDDGRSDGDRSSGGRSGPP